MFSLLCLLVLKSEQGAEAIRKILYLKPLLIGLMRMMGRLDFYLH